MSQAVIIKDAVKQYGDFTAVNGISLTIQPGEFITLRGPSGCGSGWMPNVAANTIAKTLFML